MKNMNLTTVSPQSSLHQPFTGTQVYFAGSIKGAPELDPQFAWKLVTYMIENGANVLSEHVAAPTQSEMQTIFSRNSGKSIYDLYQSPQSFVNIRQQGISWVDQATHLVALVNAPSHGVGMEIERTLLKPARGLPLTPILCLVHASIIDKLSCMIKGISSADSAHFWLKTYTSEEGACRHIDDFLSTTI